MYLYSVVYVHIQNLYRINIIILNRSGWGCISKSFEASALSLRLPSALSPRRPAAAVDLHQVRRPMHRGSARRTGLGAAARRSGHGTAAPAAWRSGHGAAAPPLCSGGVEAGARGANPGSAFRQHGGRGTARRGDSDTHGSRSSAGEGGSGDGAARSGACRGPGSTEGRARTRRRGGQGAVASSRPRPAELPSATGPTPSGRDARGGGVRPQYAEPRAAATRWSCMRSPRRHVRRRRRLTRPAPPTTSCAFHPSAMAVGRVLAALASRA